MIKSAFQVRLGIASVAGEEEKVNESELWYFIIGDKIIPVKTASSRPCFARIYSDTVSKFSAPRRHEKEEENREIN
jgi:hypothetical protein